jgi:hypothetical protein
MLYRIQLHAAPRFVQPTRGLDDFTRPIAYHAKDAAESVEERQRVPQSLSQLSRALVARAVGPLIGIPREIEGR